MRARPLGVLAACALAVASFTFAGTGSASAAAVPTAAPSVASPPVPMLGVGGYNNFGCKPSAAHPDPVVLLHGLGATYYEDINLLQYDLVAEGYCTFSLTYGDYPAFPFVGGLEPISQSAQQIASYILQVKNATGATKVDIVGHSEGAFESLYVPKFDDVAGDIASVVAIAPPTHGTSFSNLVTLAYGLVGQATFDLIADTIGVPAVSDLVTDGPAVEALDNGPIAQPGIDYTIIASEDDEMVTPTDTAFVDEPGVTNEYVQQFCPLDPVGHIGEAYDPNVWHLVSNALDPSQATPIGVCAVGAPG